MFRKNFGIFEIVEVESLERVLIFFVCMLFLEFFEMLGEFWDVFKLRRKVMFCIFIDFVIDFFNLYDFDFFRYCIIVCSLILRK